MTLRARLAITFAALAAVVALLMGALGYFAVASRITSEVDEALLAAGQRILGGPREGELLPGSGRDRPGRPGGERLPPQDRSLLVTKVDSDGTYLPLRGDPSLAPTPVDVELASEPRSIYIARTQDIDGVPYRIVTTTNGNGQAALMVGRDGSEQAAVLRSLALIMTGLAIALSLVAALIGWLLARRIAGRLETLTTAAVQVSETGRLDVTVPGAGTDEVGQLANAFNTMLARLARSQAEQQRLVQDAGHELRTPLTSIRTNVALLKRFTELNPEVQQRVVADLQGESAELATLVTELLEAAAGVSSSAEHQLIVLADVVERVAARANRRTGRRINIDADDTTVLADAAALERAVWNLVDNAIKFDDSDAAIDIHVHDRELSVADRGPGVPAADREQIFDRFYRPVESRGVPGSGLGLSIVRDVTAAHGAELWLTDREGGGTVFHVKFPAAK
ncbi:MAG: HAMP domain-containing histidine kinase [Actinomycetia bacterium]|nr:HAMP domain-containing histidine kinase [Actinomycetes bacterium]